MCHHDIKLYNPLVVNSTQDILNTIEYLLFQIKYFQRRQLLNFHKPNCRYTTTLTISIKKTSLYLSQFSPPFSPITVHKMFITMPTNTPFLYTLAICHLPIFAYSHTYNFYIENIFPTSAMGVVRGLTLF